MHQRNPDVALEGPPTLLRFCQPRQDNEETLEALGQITSNTAEWRYLPGMNGSPNRSPSGPTQARASGSLHPNVALVAW